MKEITKERPIIFSAPMVKATLDGKKTMTRSVVDAPNSTVLGYTVTEKDSLWTGLVWDSRAYKDKGPHILHPSASEYLHVPWVNPDSKRDDDRVFRVRCKYDIGDRLWVKETWANSEDWVTQNYIYKADKVPLPQDHIWHSPIFMPRRASRITLEITGIRVERLLEISEEDAIREGCFSDAKATSNGGDYMGLYAADRFYLLWDSLNGKKHPWASNPWVWVISWDGKNVKDSSDKRI